MVYWSNVNLWMKEQSKQKLQYPTFTNEYIPQTVKFVIMIRSHNKIVQKHLKTFFPVKITQNWMQITYNITVKKIAKKLKIVCSSNLNSCF